MFVRTALALALALISSSVFAHWEHHVDQPDWARRGYCQWGHGANIDGRIKWTPNGGFGVDVPNIKLLLYCGRNLMQTISYLNDEAQRIGESAGVIRQPYICSKTIWWRTEFPKAPQLENCTILKPDGSRVLLYSNPERYGGCYSSPIWLEYMKERVDSLMSKPGGKIGSIFFDNCTNYDCHCADCRAGFREYTRGKFGVEMDLSRPKDFPNLRFAKACYDADTAVRFFQEIKRYLDERYGPGILISPNIGVGYGWSSYLVNKGATDLVFIEEGFTFPPTDSTVLKYKLGLAASHGKTTGQLLGLSQTLRRARALALDKNNEAGILESFVYPEEHKLALAEAMATSGTCCVSFALREQKITASDEPYQVQNREAIHQYSQFHQRHMPLFDLSQPGAKVAVVHGIITEMGLRSTRHALAQTTTALQRCGVPYEVLIEEDLTPTQLAGYRVLFMPEVRCLSRERCDAVEAWASGGGTLVQVGSLAQADELNLPHADPPAINKLAPGGPVAFGEGWAWRPAGPLDETAPDTLLADLTRMAGPMEHVSVAGAAPAEGKVFCNLLTSRDGRTRMVHLTNSDFTYDTPESEDIRDDDGLPEARTFLSSTKARIRKTLLTPDPQAAAGLCLKFFATTCGLARDAFSLVVTLNGRQIGSLPGSQLNEPGWFQLPVPDGLLKPENEVVFQATGAPNGHPDWVAIRVDTSAKTRRTSWSNDGGATWTEDDISLDSGAQQGEAMVRLGLPEDPDRVATAADFMGKLHVNPARDIEVCLDGGNAPRPGIFRTPEGVELTIQPELRDGMAVYRVPEVPIYGMVVLQ